MKSPCSKQSGLLLSRNDQGIIIPMFAFSLVALILVCGLAVDAGRLFLCQRWAQRAADAGAYAGGAMVATRHPSTLQWPVAGGKIPSPGFDNFGVIVEQLVRANLRARGVAPLPAQSSDRYMLRGLVGADSFEASSLSTNGAGDDVTITVTPINGLPNRPETIAIDVHVKLRTNFFLMPIIPGIAKFQDVEASARTEVDPGIISVMVDTSASMNAKATPGGPSQIDLLKTSLTQFVGLFDPQRDNISLTAFGTSAELLAGFQAAGGDQGGFDATAMNATINTLAPGGSTNYSDALIRSYFEAEKLKAAKKNYFDRAEMSYVVFGDGSATAARLFLNAPQPALPKNGFSDTTTGCSYQYDYLVWTGGQSPTLPSVPFQMVASGPGVTRGLSLDTDVPALIPSCSVRGSGGAYLGGPAFGACLSDFRFEFGCGAKGVYNGAAATSAIPLRPTRTAWYDNAERIAQLSALVWADTLRSYPRLNDGSDRKAAFNVIGLGSDQPKACLASDSPWNDEQSSCAGYRNDRFLSRLAYDEPEMALNMKGQEFPGIAKSSDRAFAAPGTYRRALAANELMQIFLETAFQIKLQLVR